MHNYHRLVKGRRRDQLQVHPEDLAELGLADGDQALLRSRSGEVQVTRAACTT
jgi:predicted molibdopterin-dependent oxidoreductase YjgC